jgi:hypothetical protein
MEVNKKKNTVSNVCSKGTHFIDPNYYKLRKQISLRLGYRCDTLYRYNIIKPVVIGSCIVLLSNCMHMVNFLL